MKRITDLEEARKILANHKWWKMYRRVNEFEGEITTLSAEDIDNIIGDMNTILFGRDLSATIDVDDSGNVIAEYPAGVCKMESCEGINVGDRMLLKGFGLAYTKEKDDSGRFFVQSPTTKNEGWLTEQEISERIMH